MRKRRILWLSILLFVTVALVLVVHPTSRELLFGPREGKGFYKGRPARYWSEAIRAGSTPSAIARWREKVANWFGITRTSQPEYMVLLQGDPKAIGVLHKLLRDSDQWVRTFACNGLGNIGHRARDHHETVPALMESVLLLIELGKSGTNTDRMHATMALGSIGPEARAAVPLLEGDLQHKNSLIRLYTAKALCILDPDHDAALDLVIGSLRDKDSVLVHNAIEGLQDYLKYYGLTSALKRRQQKLVPMLLDLLQQESKRTGVRRPSGPGAPPLPSEQIRAVLKQIDPAAAAQAGIR
jgi:hypothetical protein